MTNATDFAARIAELVAAKQPGQPLTAHIGEVRVQVNADCGAYGLTVWGPGGAYDRRRDVLPERLHATALSLHASMEQQEARREAHESGHDCLADYCPTCSPARYLIPA